MSGAKRPVKIGVWRGGGPPPGYEWTVLILSLALQDAEGCLDGAQYEHMAQQVRDLAMHRDPTRSDTLSIDKVETFLELRDKGGALGPKGNVRVYYDARPKERVIRILGVDLKKNDGKTSLPVKERIKRRQRKWDGGDYPLTSIVARGSGTRNPKQR